MHRLLPVFIFLASLLYVINGLASPTNSSLTLFPSEQAAQEHCPNDEVVWLNTKTGIWHSRGGRWYSNTKSGAFVCTKEAESAGNRASLNG